MSKPSQVVRPRLAGAVLGLAGVLIFLGTTIMIGVLSRDEEGANLVLGLLAALVVVPLLYRWCTNWSLSIFAAWILGTLSFGRVFAHLGLEVGGIPLYVTELTMALLLVGLLAQGHLLPVLRTLPERRLLLLWGLLGLIALARGFPNYRLEALRESALAYYALFFLLAWALFDRPEKLKRLFQLGLIGAGGAFLFLFTRYFTDTGGLTSTGAMRYGSGTQGLVMAFLPVMALAAYLFLVTLAGWRSGRVRQRELLFVGLLSLALLLGGLLAVPERLRGDFGKRAGTLVAEPLRDPNIGYRAFVWGLYLERGMKNPALGEGFGPIVEFAFLGLKYGPEEEEGVVPHPHNDYIWIFNRMGGVALGLLLWLIWRFYRKGLRAIPCLESETQWLLVGVMGMHMVVAGFAFANVVLAGPYMGALFWILMGLGYRLMEPAAIRSPAPVLTPANSEERTPVDASIV